MNMYQKGNTLIVSLVILLAVSIVGVSSISGVSLNQKMATNFRDNDLAFQAAEAALVEGESIAHNIFENKSPTLIRNFDKNCKSDCFPTSGCSSGLCFSGTYDTSGVYDPDSECVLNNTGVRPAETRATWTDAKLHRESVVEFTRLAEKPKFIIEFLCFAQKDPAAENIKDFGKLTNYVVRVSSYAKGSSKDSEVVLQSVLHIPQSE